MRKHAHSVLAAGLMVLSIVATSCRGGKALLPNVSGKAGEVIVVMDKENWEGDLGTEVREVLGGDCPYLAQKEPLYNLVNVSPSGFSDLLKVHRNIVFFDIDPQATQPGVVYRSDVWAHPQRIIQLSAHDKDGMRALFSENSDKVLSSLEQAERDRIIANSIQYENTSFKSVVEEMVGGSPHFPTGYKLKKKGENFLWIYDEKQYTKQGVYIYRYPAAPNENFTQATLVAKRDSVLQANVPGMFENTWVTTSTYVPPTVEFLRFKGRQFAQMRGFWEVHGDFMGGPFVSHSFYSKDGKDIIVLDAWVYAPRYDKRQYLRQVEAIIYSFEWAGPDESKAQEAVEAARGE